MAGVGLVRHGMHLSLDHELIVIQIAVIRRHAEVTPHILAAHALLAGHQCLIELLAVARADDIRSGIAEQPLHGLRQIADGGGIRLLDEQVAGVGMLKGEQHQLHRLIQGHQEAGHMGVRDGDGMPGPDLVDEQRDHAAPAAHHVAIARAADDGMAALRGDAGIGIDDMLHHGLGDAHGVDGIGRLIRGQADHALDMIGNRGVEHIVRADDVRLHGLHREELAGGNLLERCRMEDVVHAGHGVRDGLRVADIADVEFDLVRGFRVLRLELVAHIVLLLFVAGEDADFADVGGKKAAQDGVAEGAGAAGDKKSFPFKCRHCFIILSF